MWVFSLVATLHQPRWRAVAWEDAHMCEEGLSLDGGLTEGKRRTLWSQLNLKILFWAEIVGRGF